MKPIKITCRCGEEMDARGGTFGGPVSIQGFKCNNCGHILSVVKYNQDIYEGFSVTLIKGDEYETREANIKLIENAWEKAGFRDDKKYLIVNGYNPPDTKQNPWHLFRTNYGNIIIGRRHRVWEVNWEDTGWCITNIVDKNSSDTQWEHGFHAWTEESLVERLKKLKIALDI